MYEQINETLASIEDESINSLNHYGVLGMKWGVRHDRRRATERATTKLEKLDSKVTKQRAAYTKAEQKSFRLRSKADASNRAWRSEKAARSIDKAGRKLNATRRARHKAEKWARRMVEVLGDETISSISRQNVELGKKYFENNRQFEMIDLVTDTNIKTASTYYRQKANRSRR